jgi:hypothetical protein
MKRKVIKMVKGLEQLEKYFVEIGVDGRVESLLKRTLINFGPENNARMKKNLLYKVMELAMESEKEIPQYVTDAFTSDDEDKYFEVKIALNNAIVKNKKRKANYSL